MWVDFTDRDSTVTTTKPSTEPTQMSTLENQTIQTEGKHIYNALLK